tara:strand:- start:17913 stop:18233 length:321 start_codon:yes stop_codon:yes gene_type:complete
MEKIYKINFLFIIIIFLHSCNTLSDAGKVLRNEKIKTTDEFLVKKRDPLVLPPDYKEMPAPNSVRNQNSTNDEKTIKEILNISKDSEGSTQSSSTIEESILKKIRK